MVRNQQMVRTFCRGLCFSSEAFEITLPAQSRPVSRFLNSNADAKWPCAHPVDHTRYALLSPAESGETNSISLTFPSSRPTSHSTSRCRDPSTTVCTRREGGRMAILAQLGLDGRHATLRGPDLTLQPPRAAQLGVPNGASGYGDFFCTTRLSHCSVHTSRAQRRRSQPERRMEQSGWAAGALRTPPCARSVRAVGRDEPFCELLTEFVS